MRRSVVLAGLVLVLGVCGVLVEGTLSPVRRGSTCALTLTDPDLIIQTETDISINTPTHVTWAAWVKPVLLDTGRSVTYMSIFSYGGDNSILAFLVLRASGDPILKWHFRTSRDVTIPNLLDGKWHHLIMSANFATNRVNIYVDGVLKQAIGRSVSAPNPSSCRAYVGQESDCECGCLDRFQTYIGSVAQMAVYNLYISSVQPDMARYLMMTTPRYPHPTLDLVHAWVDVSMDLDMNPVAWKNEVPGGPDFVFVGESIVGADGCQAFVLDSGASFPLNPAIAPADRALAVSWDAPVGGGTPNAYLLQTTPPQFTQYFDRDLEEVLGDGWVPNWASAGTTPDLSVTARWGHVRWSVDFTADATTTRGTAPMLLQWISQEAAFETAVDVLTVVDGSLPSTGSFYAGLVVYDEGRGYPPLQALVAVVNGGYSVLVRAYGVDVASFPLDTAVDHVVYLRVERWGDEDRWHVYVKTDPDGDWSQVYQSISDRYYTYWNTERRLRVGLTTLSPSLGSVGSFSVDFGYFGVENLKIGNMAQALLPQCLPNGVTTTTIIPAGGALEATVSVLKLFKYRVRVAALRDTGSATGGYTRSLFTADNTPHTTAMGIAWNGFTTASQRRVLLDATELPSYSYMTRLFSSQAYADAVTVTNGMRESNGHHFWGSTRGPSTVQDGRYDQSFMHFNGADHIYRSTSCCLPLHIDAHAWTMAVVARRGEVSGSWRTIAGLGNAYGADIGHSFYFHDNKFGFRLRAQNGNRAGLYVDDVTDTDHPHILVVTATVEGSRIVLRGYFDGSTDRVQFGEGGTTKNWYEGNLYPGSARSNSINARLGAADHSTENRRVNWFIGDLYHYSLTIKSLTASEVTDMTDHLASEYYLTCPDVTTAVAPGTTPSGTCENVFGSSTCSAPCDPGLTLAAGGDALTCGVATWDHALPVCVHECPALPLPPGGAACVETLEDVAFSSAILPKGWFFYPSTPASKTSDLWSMSGGVLKGSARRATCDTPQPHTILFKDRPHWLSKVVVGGASTLKTSVRTSLTGRGGPVFRFVDGENYYRLLLEPGATQLFLDVFFQGALVAHHALPMLGGVEGYVRPGVVYDVSVTVDGSVTGIRVESFADDRLLVDTSVDDGTLAAGSVGLYVDGDRPTYFGFLTLTTPCAGTACRPSVDGQACTVSCLPGYEPASDDQLVSRCNGAGAWVGDANPCLAQTPDLPDTTVNVTERAPVNTPVGDPLPGVPASPEHTLIYTLSPVGNEGGFFKIGGCSGQLLVAREGLDFETQPSYTLSVTLTAEGTASVTSVISVELLDQNDPPELPSLQTRSVLESAAGGDPVGGPLNVTDSDSTGLMWAIVYGNGNGAFTIDEASGQIQVAPPSSTGSVLDYETGPRYDLLVSVSDGQDEVAGQVVVHVLDANEPPSFGVAPGDPVGLTLVVTEQAAAIGGTLGNPMSALDPDVGDSLTYSLTSGGLSTGRSFEVPAGDAMLAYDPASGQLSLLSNVSYSSATAPLDFQGVAAREVLTAVLTATDSGGLATSVNATVVIAADVTFEAVPVLTSVVVSSPGTGGEDGGESDALQPDGGDVVTFSGTGFVDDPVNITAGLTLSLSSSSSSSITFPATNCTYDEDDEGNRVVVCVTGPGVGSDLLWSVVIDGTVASASTPITSSYATPSISGVRRNAAGASLGATITLDTRGGDGLVLEGNGLAPSSLPLALTKVSYGPWPLGVDFVPVFSAFVTGVLESGTSVAFDTVGGTGGAPMGFVVEVAGQASTPFRADSVGYSPPSILAVVSEDEDSTSVDVDALYTGGGDEVLVVGQHFGGGTTTDVAVTYGPIPSGTFYPATCRPGSDPFSTLVCVTQPGVGVAHRWRVTVDGQTSDLSPPNATVSYAPPELVSVTGPGAVASSTEGGDVVVLSGFNFGPAGQPVFNVSYGGEGATGLNAADCRVTTDPPASTVECKTVAGSGDGHAWRLEIGSQWSNVAGNTSYSPPILSSFAGPGAVDASTEGSDAVVLSGSNFGAPGVPLVARYRVSLSSLPLPGFGSNVESVVDEFGQTTLTQWFTASGCSVTIPHRSVECDTAPGAGAALDWVVTVDGLESRRPTTSYGEPSITSVTLESSGMAVTGAATEGGDVIVIEGSNFGPPGSGSLVQALTYGPTGTEYAATNVVVESHTTIRATLAPGIGDGLDVILTVAEQTSARFVNGVSYASPTVVSLSPALIPTTGGSGSQTIVQVVARNVGVYDPSAVQGIVFGNPEDGTLHPAVLPVTIDPAGLPSPSSRHQPVTMSFAVPDGLGANRGVRVVVFRAGSDVSPTALAASAPPSSVNLLSYMSPDLSRVAVESIVTPEDQAIASALLGVPPSELVGGRKLTVTGTNMGPPRTSDLVVRSVELLVGGLVFVPGLIRVQDSDWSHSEVVGYTLEPAGELRVTITSISASGVEVEQSSDVLRYEALSPRLELPVFPPFETDGSSEISFPAYNLLSATDLSVEIGGRNCPLLDPTDLSDTTPITDPEEKRTRIVLLGASNASAIPEDYEWTIRCAVPEGEGLRQELILFRDDTPSSGGQYVDYAPPVISRMGLVDASSPLSSDPVWEASTSAVLHVPTVSTTLVLEGSGFGLCPAVFVDAGPHSTVIDWCSTPVSSAAGPRAHNRLELNLPAGQGSGPWSIGLLVGGQTAPGLTFTYQPPSIASVTPDQGPTVGAGTELRLVGSNFGVETPTVFVGRAADPVLDPRAPGWVQSPYVAVLSDSIIEADLPPGSGSNLAVLVQVGDQLSSPSAPTAAFSYIAPTITSVSNATTTLSAADVAAGIPLFFHADGGEQLTLNGANLGGRNGSHHCVFVEWLGRATGGLVDLQCNGMEDVMGEGEVWQGHVLLHTHSQIVIEMPPGTGTRSLAAVIRDQSLPATSRVKVAYHAPTIVALTPDGGSTDGGDRIVVSGDGFGPPVLSFDLSSGSSSSSSSAPATPAYPLDLPLDTTTVPPTAALAIHFHTDCLSSTQVWGASPGDVLPAALPSSECSLAGVVQHVDASTVSFLTPSGLGVNRTVAVKVVDHDGTTLASNEVTFSYDPPVVTASAPRPVEVSTFAASTLVELRGDNIGRIDDLVKVEAADREVVVGVGGQPCDRAARVVRDVGEQVECFTDAQTVGYKNITIVVAGQSGFTPPSDPEALFFVCDRGGFGRPGEVCLACPDGATCDGYRRDVRVFSEEDYVGLYASPVPTDPAAWHVGDGFHAYPSPVSGWYNLNSTAIALADDPSSVGCPSVVSAQVEGRDVCIVPCEPAEACIGDNFCSPAYTGVRCGDCADGYYRRAGLCEECPDNAWVLIVFFLTAAVAACIAAYVLNKKRINIAFLSIGVDYMQVLAIFANSRASFPPFITDVLHLLSAFNFNLEITAPECSIPEVSYKAKWFFYMGLPLAALALFVVMFLVNTAFDRLVKGQRGSARRHLNSLLSPVLVMMYFLYLHITRNVIDIFNCSPILPEDMCALDADTTFDDTKYLQVGVLEKCGEPGGLQMTLLPFAILALLVYVLGYPAFVFNVLYRHRHRVMEDQLLRAKLTGDTLVSNPNQYHFRKRYHKLYYHFKPAMWFWIMVIILRKFLLAFTALVFNKNAAFQMSVALLVLFASFALQVRFRPFLSSSECEVVLREHTRLSYVSGSVHSKLAARLAGVAAQSKRKTKAQTLSRRKGGLPSSSIGSLLFNMNTVEATLLCCAVLVNLGGIMFESGRFDTGAFDTEKSTVEVVLVIVIIGSLLYYVTVLVVEIGTLCQVAAITRLSEKKAKQKKAADKVASGPTVNVSTDANSQVTNPMFLQTRNRASSTSSSQQRYALDSVLASSQPPDINAWQLFRKSYEDLQKDVQNQHQDIARLRQQMSLRAMAGRGKDGFGGGGGGGGKAGGSGGGLKARAGAMPRRTRKQFKSSPTRSPPGSVGSQSTSMRADRARSRSRGMSGVSAGEERKTEAVAVAVAVAEEVAEDGK